MKIVPILFCLLFFGQLFGQNMDNYQVLECEGPIPDEFLESSLDKFYRDQERIQQQIKDATELQDVSRYSLQTNYLLDEILRSGVVLFNDPISQYLNEVLQVVQAVETNRDGSVRIYALRDPSVNAFATDRGNIFVTLGLLSQLENEAQLAFILAHELVHFEERHSLNTFLQGLELERDVSWQKAQSDDLDLTKNLYSKELELEADERGTNKILKTNYSLSTLNTVFDILKYAALPFDEIPFSKSYFEDNNFRFPAEYHLTELNPITGENENEDDDESTHPNIGARRALFTKQIQTVKEEGRQEYLVSKERFEIIREYARFELPYLYLYQDRLPEALYTAHALLKSHPDNLYLKKVVAKTLHAYARYQSYSNSYYPIRSTGIEGELHQTYHFLDELSQKEISVLALRYLWDLHQAFPDDAEVTALMEDACKNFARHFDSLDDFSNEPFAAPDTNALASQPEVTSEEPAEDANKSKFEKIWEKKKLEQQPSGENYWSYAFVEALSDPAFLDAVEKGREALEEEEEEYDYYQSAEGRKAYRRYEEETERKGLQMGIKRVVAVKPFFLMVDKRKNGTPMYEESIEGKQELSQNLTTYAQEVGLDFELLDPTLLAAEDVDAFNALRYINDWVGQQLEQGDIPRLPGYQQAKVNALADAFETDYFLWTGVAGWKKNKGTFFYAILFDIRTGKNQAIRLDFYKKRLRMPWVNGMMYDVLNQIRVEEKE